MSDSETARQTPLHDAHVALGGRMVEFAGFRMPVQYTGVLDEHRAVRERVGLFDVSHMGEFLVEGPGSLDTIQLLTANDASKLDPGKAQYSLLTTEEGTIVDDLLVYKLDGDRFLVIVNAANRERDLDWFTSRAREGTTVRDLSDDYALLALQGPRAGALLSKLTLLPLDSLKRFRFLEGEVAGIPGTVSRTGYTGEDGFEILCPPEQAIGLWDAILEAGREEEILPCGLASRDTLRLEAAYCLHGNDIDETTTALEAGLGWVVKLDKGDFLGRAALLRQKEEGVPRKLTGFRVTGKGIARHGYPVLLRGEPTGEVTSGSHSPSLGYPIGLTYLPTEATEPGTAVEIEVRGNRVGAEVVPTPFYKKPS